MPIPKPGNKSKDKYISDCMANEVMQKEYPKQSQRYAVCLSTYERAKKKAKGEEIRFEDNIINGFVIVD